MKTSISIEDSKKKVSMTTETTHKHRPISKGNRIALEQVVVNQRKETTIDKQRLVVREEKREVREKKIVSYYTTGEKEKKRIPHKHKSGVYIYINIYLIMIRIIYMHALQIFPLSFI
jgi:ADP-ribosylglycohydrolase